MLNQHILQRVRNTSYVISVLCVIAGLVMSILSWANICTEACAEGHNYRLFHMKFEPFGVIYFILLGIFLLWSKYHPSIILITALMLACGLGAEIVFILIQKYEIGSWCPLCVGIAFCIATASLCLFIYSLCDVEIEKSIGKKGGYMKLLKNSFAIMCMMVFGTLFAYAGVEKIDKTANAEKTVKDQLAFGDSMSPIEAYIFTDWQCPACRKIEPSLRDMMPSLEKNAKIIFVDIPLHPESNNFTPYHLSFMIHNKKQYWKLRHMLNEIAQRTSEPKDSDVQNGAKKFGVNYKQLNYSDVAIGIRYFDRLGKQFSVKGTPTVVIVNTETKKGKKLKGASEISESNVLKAISTLKE